MLENLSRWYVHGALWSLDDSDGANAGLVDEVADLMVDRLTRLAGQSQRSQRRWGVDFARAALRGWERRVPRSERRAVAKRPPFAKVLTALEAVAARS